MNQPPDSGVCTVTPEEGISITTEFELTCSDWNDPEESGIRQYTVNRK